MKDTFIVQMRFKDIQPELRTLSGSTPDETLNSALLQEKGTQPASSLQKKLENSAPAGISSHHGSVS